jgi:hypothetical protein
MLTAVGFFKAFFGFFDFGRTSTVVRLCAFMCRPPSYCLRNSSKRCASQTRVMRPEHQTNLCRRVLIGVR